MSKLNLSKEVSVKSKSMTKMAISLVIRIFELSTKVMKND